MRHRTDYRLAQTPSTLRLLELDRLPAHVAATLTLLLLNPMSPKVCSAGEKLNVTLSELAQWFDPFVCLLARERASGPKREPKRADREPTRSSIIDGLCSDYTHTHTIHRR